MYMQFEQKRCKLFFKSNLHTYVIHVLNKIIQNLPAYRMCRMIITLSCIWLFLFSDLFIIWNMLKLFLKSKLLLSNCTLTFLKSIWRFINYYEWRTVCYNKTTNSTYCVTMATLKQCFNSGYHINLMGSILFSVT